MKFLIDAQFPRKLVSQIVAEGFTAIHTLDLPDGNKTSDEEINALSLRDNYIVVTKDADFVNSFTLYRKPFKLLLVSTGNISNKELADLFRLNIKTICDLFKTYDFIEFNRSAIITHT